MTPEGIIQRQILDALRYVPGVVVWRMNAGRRAGVQFGVAGQADVFVLLPPHGTLLGLEVKTRTGKTTPEQLEWGAEVERVGGLYRVVRSADEALRVVFGVMGRGTEAA